MEKNRRQDHDLRQAVNGLHSLLIRNTDLPFVRFCDCFVRAVVQLCEADAGVLFVQEEEPNRWRTVAGWPDNSHELPNHIHTGFASYTRWMSLPQTPQLWSSEQVTLLAECTRDAIGVDRDFVYSFPVLGDGERPVAMLVLWSREKPGAIENKVNRLRPLSVTFARLLTPSVRASLAVSTFFDNHTIDH